MVSPVAVVEPCSKVEREFFTSLLLEHERARRDVALAFTAFCHAHGVPLGSELESVTEHGLMIKRAESDG